jgi:hypothetical protein
VEPTWKLPDVYEHYDLRENFIFIQIEVCSKTEANNYLPASIILSTLASLIPLICKRSFLGEYATDSTVQRPASLSFFTSSAAIPDAYTANFTEL